MLKRVAVIAFVGWAGILALAWWLADRRIAFCHDTDSYTAQANCLVRATAARDSALILGLSVGLVGAILLSLVATRFSSRSDRFARGAQITIGGAKRDSLRAHLRNMKPGWWAAAALAMVLGASVWMSAQYSPAAEPNLINVDESLTTENVTVDDARAIDANNTLEEEEPVANEPDSDAHPDV